MKLFKPLKLLYYIWQQRSNLLTFIGYDFTQSYLASYFGFAWAIIGPLVTLSVLTVVFQMGFRVPPISTSGVPFVVWLTCGMIPWLFFADALTSCTNAVKSYAFLVRKAMFRIAFLPIVRLTALCIIHLCMMLFLIGLLIFFDFMPSIYWLQWFYYIFLMYLFLLGVAWCTSSLSVFVPDISSIITIVTTLGFWVTPIFWNPSMLPAKWHWVFVVNPAHYLVQGYRDTFIDHRWFWERPMLEHAVFAVWLILALTAGILIFKKLRPLFADIL